MIVREKKTEEQIAQEQRERAVERISKSKGFVLILAEDDNVGVLTHLSGLSAIETTGLLYSGVEFCNMKIKQSYDQGPSLSDLLGI